MKAKIHHECTYLRRMRVSHGTLNFETGRPEVSRIEWQTRPCGSPLFREEEKKTGLCSGCARGWESTDNRRATEDEVREYELSN